MLAELDDPKFTAPGRTFVPVAVEQRDEVHAVQGTLGIGGSIRQRQFDAPARLVPHEDIVQHPVRIDAFGVENGGAAAERAKTAGVELSELRLLDRRPPQRLHLAVGARNLEERQPPEAHGDHRGKHE